MVDLLRACTMFIISAHVCVAGLDWAIIPYVDIPCDETAYYTHVLYTQYNNGRYIECVTRVNEAR